MRKKIWVGIGVGFAVIGAAIVVQRFRTPLDCKEIAVRRAKVTDWFNAELQKQKAPTYYLVRRHADGSHDFDFHPLEFWNAQTTPRLEFLGTSDGSDLRIYADHFVRAVNTPITYASGLPVYRILSDGSLDHAFMEKRRDVVQHFRRVGTRAAAGENGSILVWTAEALLDHCTLPEGPARLESIHSPIRLLSDGSRDATFTATFPVPPSHAVETSWKTPDGRRFALVESLPNVEPRSSR